MIPESGARSDTLASVSKYPPINLTVNVAIEAPSVVTNAVTVSGGGKSNVANDTVTDGTIVSAVSRVTITTASPLRPGIVGVAYSSTLSVAGGSPPYKWSLASGTLPPGLELSTLGLITGTPVEAGVSTLTVRVTDAGAISATQSFGLTINSALP